jgi:tyrosine-protein phosphatase non-receptor type 4
VYNGRSEGSTFLSCLSDHGTPDSPGEFVEFVEVVRETREKSAAITPTVVHCSAGIGRTGVLILMETAACLVEANQPVYPLDLTRVMRDQRPAMIQTPSQYKFVCEAISSVYREGRIKPLPEFQQS